MSVNNPILTGWFDKDLSKSIPLPSTNDKKRKIKNYPFESQCNTFRYSTFNPDIHKEERDIDKEIKKINATRNKAIKTVESKNKKNKTTVIKSLNTRYDKMIANINKTTSCVKWKLEFSNTQQQKLFEYIKECNKVYNYCVDLHKNDPGLFEKPYTDIKVGIFDKFYGENTKDAPYDTLTDEVRIFCSNLKSCLTNYKNGNIKHFTMSYVNNKKNKSIFIPKKYVKLS